MKDSNMSAKNENELRILARERLRDVDDGNMQACEQNVEQLIHELQIHQVELELQNEELKQAQLQTAILLESEQQSHRLLEDLPVYISSFLPDGTVTYVNEALADIAGMRRKEMIGQSFFEWCNPDEMKLLRKRLISTFALPGATLRKEYSSRISMGMGFSIMMEATDNVMLCTGAEGTTIVLSTNLFEYTSGLTLDDLPDTWSEISGFDLQD